MLLYGGSNATCSKSCWRMRCRFTGRTADPLSTDRALPPNRHNQRRPYAPPAVPPKYIFSGYCSIVSLVASRIPSRRSSFVRSAPIPVTRVHRRPTVTAVVRFCVPASCNVNGFGKGRIFVTHIDDGDDGNGRPLLTRNRRLRNRYGIRVRRSTKYVYLNYSYGSEYRSRSTSKFWILYRVHVNTVFAMYVQVRMMDTGKSVLIPTSRTNGIREFKKLVEERFNIKPESQRLFFAGKQVSISIVY